MISNKKIKKLLVRTAQGFTLIETLVAVLILITAIAGPLTIASKGLNAALVSKDQITAFYLAQDAVEYVRYKRDSACLAAGVSPCATATWLGTGTGGGNGNLADNCTSSDGSKTCYVDPIKDKITNIAACTGGYLKYDYTNNFFGYTSGTCGIFKRTVSIQTPVDGSSNQVKLVVAVSWTDLAGVAHPAVSVTENLFNWQ